MLKHSWFYFEYKFIDMYIDFVYYLIDFSLKITKFDQWIFYNLQ